MDMIHIRVIILDHVESTRIKTQRDKNPSFNSNLVFDIGERLADEIMTHQNDNIYDKGFPKRNPNNKTQFVDSVKDKNFYVIDYQTLICTR